MDKANLNHFKGMTWGYKCMIIFWNIIVIYLTLFMNNVYIICKLKGSEFKWETFCIANTDIINIKKASILLACWWKKINGRILRYWEVELATAIIGEFPSASAQP